MNENWGYWGATAVPNRPIAEIVVPSGVKTFMPDGTTEVRLDEEPRRARPEMRFGHDEHGRLWFLHFANRNIVVGVIA